MVAQAEFVEMNFLKLFTFLALVVASYQAKSFRDHKVVSFKIQNDEQLKELQSLEVQPGVRYLAIIT